MSKPLTLEEKRKLIEAEREENLPHLFGWYWYAWARKFFNSTNRFNFLCAANQISKSSTQIRKCIDWATDQSKWESLWINKPTQFWYLYPTRVVATIEFNEKWVPEFLPRGEMKEDAQYGWSAEYKNREIWAIHFNSGVSVYFKTYEQDTQTLQTSTCYAIFTDEELPFEHFNELRSRLIATNGYFHMVFTATLGQDQWRRTMEPTNKTEELFPDALKVQVSMYDCLHYDNGKKSFWTPERIKEIEDACSSENEIQKRVYGRFIISSGLKIPGFNRGKNMVPQQKIPDSWNVYSGVDIGTGGETGHPAAICFVAVRPDYKFGIVFRGWRGDGITTSSSDILEKHNELAVDVVPTPGGELKKVAIPLVLKSYDWHSKDFFIIASRAGAGFTPADKRRDAGYGILNTLFKMQMLGIMDGDPELAKLVIELTSLQETDLKRDAVDDFVDSLRYCIMSIPWDFDGASGEIFKVEEKQTDERSAAQRHYDERRSGPMPRENVTNDIEAEFAEWQGLIDGT
jgi:hypothetical protein